MKTCLSFGRLWLALTFAGIAGPTFVRAADWGNVVIVVAPDLGYGDLSCHGGPIETPNLDKLFADSFRLTNFHVSPTPNPTRAAFLTGRYALRTGVWHERGPGSMLPSNEITLGDAMSRRPSSRAGFFGTWGAR